VACHSGLDERESESASVCVRAVSVADVDAVSVRVNFGREPWRFADLASLLPAPSARPDHFVAGQRVTLMQLPREIVQMIVVAAGADADATRVMQLMQVCKAWRGHASGNELWRPLFSERWPRAGSRELPNIKSWYTLYRRRANLLARGKSTADLLEGCDWEFKCPLLFSELKPVPGESSVRHCDQCDRHVYLCRDKVELNKHVEMSHCIAYEEYRRKMMGRMVLRK
jgi:hypothetical protein